MPSRSHLDFAVICLVWGTTWIAIKAGIANVAPILFAGSRFTVAGLILLLLIAARREPLRLARSDLPRLVAVIMLVIVGTYAPLFWGARYVSSGIAAILDLAFMPVVLLIAGCLLGQDRLSAARAAGVATGVAGLLVLYGPKALAQGRTGNSLELWGAAAIVLSAVLYSVGSVVSRPLLGRYAPLLISGISTFAGGVILMLGSLLFEPGAMAALGGNWGLAAWTGWAFLVVFGSLIAFTLYLRLIGEWGASRAGSYAFVSPIVAVLLGVAVYGEQLTLLDGIGMAAMLAGAWLSLRPVAPTTGEAGAVAIRPVSACQSRPA